MSDTPLPASSTEKAIVVTNAQLCRLWTFTYISIGLNVLILVAFLVCAIIHHGHHKHHQHHGQGGADWGRHGGMQQSWGGGRGHGFRHFGGMGLGWGNRGGFGGDRQDGGMGFRGNGFGGGGQGPSNAGGDPGMQGNGGPGMMNGGPGGWGGKHGRDGFGGRGMMGDDRNGPPDPAKITDMLLNRLSAQLNLTDDEKARIKPIIQDQAAQMQKDMEAQRLARQKAMEDTKAKIKALLTADQQKQLDAIPLPGEKPVTTAAPAPAAAK